MTESMVGVGGPPLLSSSRHRSLKEVKNNQHVQRAQPESTVKKLWTDNKSPPSPQRANSGQYIGSITMPNKPKLYKRAKSTGNFLKPSGNLQRVTSFSELHELTRSSNALNWLKDRHRKKPVTKEEFDTRTKELENELKLLRCEIMVLRRCWREKTKENSRTFMKMTKYLAWVTGVHLLILRVLSFVRWKYKQDIIKDLSWTLFLRLIRSSKGRKQLQMYLHHVLQHQIKFLTIKISPDLISLFCLSRPSEMFRICGFLVVLFNDPIRLYQQLIYPSRDTPRVSSVLANLGANVLFLTSRWWIVAHGLPAAVRTEYAGKRISDSSVRSTKRKMISSPSSNKSQKSRSGR